MHFSMKYEGRSQKKHLEELAVATPRQGLSVPLLFRAQPLTHLPFAVWVHIPYYPGCTYHTTLGARVIPC
jgi:hypothetical protein